MNIVLKQVMFEEKETLRNLLEKYDYEFSQYDHRDVDSLGLFGYFYLDHYWVESNRWAYFIVVDEKLAGFVMVNTYPEVKDQTCDFQIAEFFILHKYRKRGVGFTAFSEVLKRHQGRWQLKVHPKNVAADSFWQKSINVLTNGQYKKILSYPDTEYDDGTCGHIYFFDNTAKKE